MKIAEFFASLGFKSDNKELVGFENSIKSVQRNMIGLKELILGGLIYAVDKFIESSTRGATQLTNFNQQTGLSVQKLQQWRSAAQLANPLLSEQEVDSSIANLDRYLRAVKLGRASLDPFNLMGGIDVANKDAFELLMDLREKAKTMRRGDFTDRLGELGISAGMANVFQLDDETFNKLSQLFIRTEDVQEANFKAAVSAKFLTMQFNDLKDKLVADFAPSIEKAVTQFSAFATGLENFLSKNKAEFDQFVEDRPHIKEGLSNFANVLDETVGLLSNFFENFKIGLGFLFDLLTVGYGAIFTEAMNLFKKTFGFEPEKNADFGKLKEGVNEAQARLPNWVKSFGSFATGKNLFAPKTEDLMMMDRLKNLQKPAVDNTMNNNFYINSTANADEIAKSVIKQQEDMLYYSTITLVSDYNNNGY